MSKKAVTVSDLVALGKRLVLTCQVCNTVSTKDLSDIFFRPKMEFEVLQYLLQCPECGYCNSSNEQGKLIVTVE